MTQSGAIMAGIVDWASARGIGFSHLVSVGAMADVDFGDLLDYFAQDPATSAILLYMEAVTQARKFMSAARAASRRKPVIVLKAGRHAEGARAVASHTGALAGADGVYSAAFRRAGMLRVRSLQELFDAAEILASSAPVKGDRLAIVSNGGGFGVLATDALIEEGGHLAQLAPATLQRLDAVLPPTWSHGNPVDIVGDAPGRRYADTLEHPARGSGHRRDPGAELPDRYRFQHRCRAGGRRQRAEAAAGASDRQLGRRQPHRRGRPAACSRAVACRCTTPRGRR